MNKKGIIFFVTIGLLVMWVSCKDATIKDQPATTSRVSIPAANADSIYSFVEKQVSFGHRIPGTPTHLACKEWLADKLRSYGAKVLIQEFESNFMGQSRVPSFNIIAQINPDQKKRVLLAAHWDSRKVAEKDPNESLRQDPILGADDGGSGVAALLEIARIIQDNPIQLGIDIILFDAEDQGVQNSSDETWCLGSQYWSRNKHKRNYTAKYGILLDMVGAKKASFGKEGISREFASPLLDKVWTLAQRMGYSDLFIDQAVPKISDDHLYVNRYAGIPMIDIINYDIQKNKFAHYHHTHTDNMSVIDKRTLRAVTQVVLATIYKESENSL